MAEVTERDRRVARGLGLPWESTFPAGEPIALQRLVAYRESCVAEERAARLKAEGERDKARKGNDNYIAMMTRLERRMENYQAHATTAEARLRAVIEALRQISEPDQGPLSTALATGDDMRIIQAVTHALNTGRDIARAALRDAQASPEPETSYIDIVFDGPPEHEAGRFVEVENPEGRSVRVGKWIKRENGWWSLRLPWSKHGGRDGK